MLKIPDVQKILILLWRGDALIVYYRDTDCKFRQLKLCWT